MKKKFLVVYEVGATNLSGFCARPASCDRDWLEP